MKRNLYITVKFAIVLIIISSFSINYVGISEEGAEDIPLVIVKETLIDSVWAANRVWFALQTVGDLQFVAYYDKNRMMTVASRKIGDDSWKKKTLPNKLRWDSHNSVAMGIDAKGYIHVAGNMHADPLNYFRSKKPYDVSSMVELNKLIGIDEESVTYPKFFYNKEGDLLFSYRSGSCGNGNILVNRFIPEQEKWERYLKKSLFEGVGESDDRAAYHKFVKDSEGNFHFIWIWRWTPHVETSHQICYATTSDLMNWKNAAGETVSLPFRPDNDKLIVDGAPSKGGMHNSRYQIILTPDNEPVVGYVKYDEDELTQFYLARFVDNQWISKKISDWNFRWIFLHPPAGSDERMTIGGSFQFAGFSDDGFLAIDWETETGNSGRYIIDTKTLDHVDKAVTVKSEYPDELFGKMTDDPEMSVRMIYDSGESPDKNIKYVLKWESMRPSHGRFAPEIIPDGPFSNLMLVSVKNN
jgi:hypothetical protein